MTDRLGGRAAAPRPNYRGRVPIVADLAVVGGGIAGVSVAYELAATRSVLLLEAEPALGTHATARSAATWIPGHGVATVRALTTASGPRFAQLAAELDTPPLLAPRSVLWVATDAVGEAALAAQLAERAAEPLAAVPLQPDEARRRCPALRDVRAAALVATAADVDVDALHRGYVRGLRARGGLVRAGARVVALDRTGSGWALRLADGDPVHVGEVVDAAGAWADVVATVAGVPPLGLTPLRRTIAVVRVPDPVRLRAPDGGPLPMACEAADRWYFKADGPNLLVSPADETPAEPGDARPEELDVALALERVEAVTGLGLRSVVTSWAGLRSFVPDRRPVVGAWPDHPGFWFVAGQGGSGIETAPALSALAASVVTGASPPADLPVDPADLAPARTAAADRR
jgi:D-arginine dehydrogenase